MPSAQGSRRTALAATFVDGPNDKTRDSAYKPFVSCPLPGALLARPRVALATRLSVAPTLLMLAALVAAADPCAAQDPSVLARAGTAAIEHRRFADALEAFTRAAAIRPDDASLCFGAGVAAFMLGQDDVAQTRFECALALNPNHLQAAVWLGDLHYRAGRLPDAISIYESARTALAGGGELQEQLDNWRKEQELQSRFHEVQHGALHGAVRGGRRRTSRS